MTITPEESEKPIDKKFRWEADLDGTSFELYIPKWRVPDPKPRLIHVTIDPYAGEYICRLSRIEADQSPEKRQRPIIAHLEYVAPKTETIQYKPDEGDDEDWEIGQPYIPTPMTFDESERLTMTVNWK